MSTRLFYACINRALICMKGYVFGDKNDNAKTFEICNNVRRHQIEINQLKNDKKLIGQNLIKRSIIFFAASQPQHRLIRGIFDKTLNTKTVFFMISHAWTMPLAFGMPYAELNAAAFNQNLLGEKVTAEKTLAGGIVNGKSEIGYLMEWSGFYAPAVLYELQSEGITAKVATNTFDMAVAGSTKKYNYGTVLVPVSLQNLNSTQLYDRLKTISEKYSVQIQGIQNGSVSGGSDLGSSKFLR